MRAGARGQLVWYVDAAGYEVGKPASDVLMGRPPGDVRQAVKRRGGALEEYCPGQIPDLYRRFLDMPDDESAVVDFVSQYGFLGTNVPLEWDEHLQMWRSRTDATSWEAVDAIQNHRSELGALVDYLEDVLTEEGRRGPSQYDDDPRMRVAAHFTNEAPDSFSLGVLPVERAGGRLGVEVVPQPTTLLALMWWQVAEAIRTGLLWRVCEMCGTGFQVGPGAARMDKLTCSPRCQRARHRKRHAREG